jgi:glyoxylase-like metal-dependent hydrolase (beta-lactamase superfamily II)
MSWKSLVLLSAAVPLLPVGAQPLSVEKIAPSVSVVRGPVNGVLIQRGGETLAIYGDPRPDPVEARQVLFTHHRRDVVWAGRRLVERGAEAVAPEMEKSLFTAVGQFWEDYRTHASTITPTSPAVSLPRRSRWPGPSAAAIPSAGKVSRSA